MTLWEQDQAVTQLGVIDGENIDDYHAGPGLSSSGLKHFKKTPLHYFITRGRRLKETDAQRLGTIGHMALLERERFEQIVVPVAGNRNKNSVKEVIAALEAQGKYVCQPKEYEFASKIAKKISTDDDLKKALTGGKAEQSIRWRDPETGVLLKCRPDYLHPNGVVIDIKTFEDLSPENLDSQIGRMKYHWQAHMYLMGVNQVFGKSGNTMFAHLFLDTVIADAVLSVLEDAALEKAEADVRPLINRYAECLKNDSWPGYPRGIVTSSLPSYEW